MNCVLKRQNKEKEAGNGPFLKKVGNLVANYKHLIIVICDSRSYYGQFSSQHNSGVLNYDGETFTRYATDKLKF